MKIFKTINLKGVGKKYSGKTRDFYITNGKRIIISTDRISAFDKVLDYIPYKGQVLNLLSVFWFDKTKNIISNHLVSTPHSNVMIVKNAKLIPIEMVVRGYITGVTGTSIWGSYEKGERIIYGLKFKNNLRKNQKLPKPIITPTTKAEKGHDQRLTEKEILKKQIVDKKMWNQMKKTALKLFERGTKICAKGGIILVDTKYEFGICKNKLMLIDEIHTPDSSRYFYSDGYAERQKKGEAQKQLSKEFVREWLMANGFQGKDGQKIPEMTDEVVKNISERYIELYENILGEKFQRADASNVLTRVEANINSFLKSSKTQKQAVNS